MDEEYFRTTFHFSQSSERALYIQLAAYIRIQIQAGVLKPGDQMLPEMKLCEILNVSRTTVRQCMRRLTEDGLVRRYRGKGSYIADQKMRRNINYLYNFTEDMRRLGAEPASVVLSCEVVEGSEFIKEQLKLPREQSEVFHLKRLRCADQEPILLENTYIPYYLAKGVEKFDFEKNSLYYTLSEYYSLQLEHATEMIEAIVINDRDAEMLNCKTKMAGYKIQRISYLDSGYIYEYTVSVTRADKCIFELELYKDAQSNHRPVDIRRNVSVR
ncbi:GntR family transcriptional regulator [Diplocloster hominis]|uniref:GntR family transcriptional regulator n=1 Tax=Diplocloster hominis TaxID=3079010 RepID=UPI0031BBC273